MDQNYDSFGLKGLSGEEVINKLDTLLVADRNSTLYASIRPGEVQLAINEQFKQSISLPENKFYLSFAPYLNQTHDCYYHSLTTCKGELANTEISVTITDEAGNVILKESGKTFDNGFYGVWLPKGITGKLLVEAEGLSAESSISTKNADDATCLTTLKLS